MTDEVYWRNTARDPRFFGVDARAVYVFLPVLFHLRLWTCAIAAFSLLLFWIVEQFGLTPGVALRTGYFWCVTGGWRWGDIDNHLYLNQRGD